MDGHNDNELLLHLNNVLEDDKIKLIPTKNLQSNTIGLNIMLNM